MYKCPKCGFECADDAKFCSHCGSKIEKTKFCTQCCKELKSEQIFCPECGARVGMVDFDKESVFDKTKTTSENSEFTSTSKISLDRIITIIAEAFAILFVVIAMISVWGDFVTAEALGLKTSLGVKYWFEDGWKIMKQTDASIASTKLFFILGFISFIAAVAGVFSAGITAIVQCSKGILQHKNTSFKGAKAVGVSAFFPLFYFIFAFLTQCVYLKSDYITLPTKLGWGAILFGVFLLITLAVSLIRKFVVNENNRYKGGTAIAREAISFVTIAILTFVGFNVMSAVEQEGQTTGYSPLAFIQILDRFRGQSSFPTVAYKMAEVSTIFIVCAILMLCFAVCAFFVENTAMRKVKVKGFLIPLSVCFTLAFVFSLISTENYLVFVQAPNTILTVPTVYSIVGLVVIICGTIAYFICDHLNARNTMFSNN